MPMPVWLAQVFCERYMAWHLLRVKTLDEAFKVKRSKNLKFPERSQREKLKPEVTRQVFKLQVEGVRGKELWRRVCFGLRISEGTARSIFYAADNRANRKFFDVLVRQQIPSRSRTT